MAGALDGLRVLDLSRVLAGPSCTQLLGDLGAEIIKIENPRTGGDDTRSWGPPYVADGDGQPSDLSTYFMSANRNKLSVSADLKSVEGRDLIHALAATSDVLIENFKPGGLTKYALDYDAVSKEHPHLVYVSISGFGHTGPNSGLPGYDIMAQGYGGLMSLTGAPDGEPTKAGMAIADIMAGMYAAVGTLAALRHREKTGKGQHVDVSLVDAQMAWLYNEGVSYLNTGEVPIRRGNGHANIVPYQVFETSDGHVIIAIGNDSQFAHFAEFLGRSELASDPRFDTNPKRLENRDALLAILRGLISEHTVADVVAGCGARNVPAGPVNTLDQVYASDQAEARNMVVEMPSPVAPGQTVKLLGNPLKMSATPPTYRRPPPSFGQDTDTVLRRFRSDPD
ncbi:MAG: CaiB/BaiF CoA-transferase family protein [Pseudomonadota bacterium]